MRRLHYFVLPCLTLLCGCYGTSEGVEVPQDEIYFPVGLALDPSLNSEGAPKFLYAVSSDFDLQYNGGAVQSYDLDLIAGRLPQPCESGVGLCGSDKTPATRCFAGEKSSADQLLYPGPCNSLTPSDYQTSKVKIGAFATDVILRQDPEPSNPSKVSSRLFVPVRGDSTLHFIDVDGGELECGQGNNGGACDSAHRAGDDPKESSRSIQLNAEPFAIDADPSGRTLVVSNQTTGTLSLFVTAEGAWRSGPQLKFALSSSSIPSRPVGVASVPRPENDGAAEDGDAFMVTFRNSAQVRLVRFSADYDSSPERSYLVDGGGVGIDANSVGSDSRGIAVDDSARREAEERCAGDATCLASAALVPLDVFVANRSPSSLLIGRTRPPQQYPYFYDTVPLTAGPSRVVLGKVQAADGTLETRVFVACFDSRRVYIYDPKRARLEAEIFTGRGPHALAVDTQRKYLYVGHFTDSYIGVYSLDLQHPDSYGTMLGALGQPRAPRSSK